MYQKDKKRVITRKDYGKIFQKTMLKQSTFLKDYMKQHTYLTKQCSIKNILRLSRKTSVSTKQRMSNIITSGITHGMSIMVVSQSDSSGCISSSSSSDDISICGSSSSSLLSMESSGISVSGS